MIKVYEFKLSQDGKHLYVHIAANKVAPTTDAILSTLTISMDGDFNSDASKAFGTYLATLDTPVVENTGTTANPIWTITDAFQDEVTVNIDLEAVGALGECIALDQLYYLKVTAASAHSTCVSVDEVNIITFDKYPIYKALSCAMDSLVGCEPPQLVMDYLLRLKALEASIELGIHYKDDINMYYNWLIKRVPLMAANTNMRVNNHRISRPCGCGR